MLNYLRGASPWLRFIGIIGFITCGLFGVFVLVALILAMVGFQFSEMPGGAAALFSGMMIFYFLALGALIFFPSMFIYKFGKKIRQYSHSGADADLEEAFKNNKSLWKFLGILTIIELAFVPIMIIIGIAAGIASFL